MSTSTSASLYHFPSSGTSAGGHTSSARKSTLKRWSEDLHDNARLVRDNRDNTPRPPRNSYAENLNKTYKRKYKDAQRHTTNVYNQAQLQIKLMRAQLKSGKAEFKAQAEQMKARIKNARFEVLDMIAQREEAARQNFQNTMDHLYFWEFFQKRAAKKNFKREIKHLRSMRKEGFFGKIFGTSNLNRAISAHQAQLRTQLVHMQNAHITNHENLRYNIAKSSIDAADAFRQSTLDAENERDKIAAFIKSARQPRKDYSNMYMTQTAKAAGLNVLGGIAGAVATEGAFIKKVAEPRLTASKVYAGKIFAAAKRNWETRFPKQSSAPTPP